MQDKAYWESKYKTSYDCANNFIKQKNLTAAKESLKKALEAAIKLAENSTGSEKMRYKSNAESVGELLDRINTRLAAVRETQNAKPATDKTAAQTQRSESEDTLEKITVEQALDKLNALEGLHTVKQQVTELVDMLKAFEMRKSRGLPVPPFSYHLVFTGNAGSGKTTVARIIAQIYCALGIVSKGKFVEVQRADLVAGYVGQTANKTKDAIARAMGGVLFIDEAYSLYKKDGGNDYGIEAITTLLKAMEDNRDDFVVIVAGYEEEMIDFINSNPGLATRFKKTIHFEDYTGEEMYRIFQIQCKNNKYIIGEGVESILRKHFDEVYSHRTRATGNGRYVRNIFENALQRQSSRVVKLGKGVSDEALMTFCPEDLVLPTMEELVQQQA